MAGFDVTKAREAGYDDAEIAKFLSDENKYNYQGALDAGFSDAEIIDELMTRPKSGTELAKEAATVPEKVSDYLFEEQPPEEFSIGRVATSTGLGAGIGGVLGGPPGAVAGGVAGAAGGVAGEFARMAGTSRATQFGAEFAGGFAPAWIRQVGSMILNPKLLKGTPVLEGLANLLKPKTFQDRVKYKTKQKLFGNEGFKGSASTLNAEATQLQLRNQYNIMGDSDLAVSNILRKSMLEGIDRTAKGNVTKTIIVRGKPVEVAVPNIFFHSDDFSLLLDDLDALVQRGKVSPSEVKKIKQIMSNQQSPNKKVSENAISDILNFIQNRGLRMGKKQTGGKVEEIMDISVDTQKALRYHFDNYVSKNTNAEGYNALKAAERMEFGATAADSIPTLILSKFKKGSQEVDFALNNIRNFEGGKEMLIKAVNRHFSDFGTKFTLNKGVRGEVTAGGNLNADDLMSEWFRIRPMLEDAGVMSRDEIIKLSRNLESKINSIPKTMRNEKTKQFIADTIKNGLIGATVGQTPKVGEEVTGEKLFML
jgi:hypothetical protein